MRGGALEYLLHYLSMCTSSEPSAIQTGIPEPTRVLLTPPVGRVSNSSTDPIPYPSVCEMLNLKVYVQSPDKGEDPLPSDRDMPIIAPNAFNSKFSPVIVSLCTIIFILILIPAQKH